MAIVFLPTRMEQFGEQKDTTFKTWSLKGINKVQNLWNGRSNRWKSIKQLRRSYSYSKRGEQNLKDLQRRVPWNMSIGSHLPLGQWVVSFSFTPLDFVYQILHVVGSNIYARCYFKLQCEQLVGVD
jgi:hypothetical protein